MRMVSCLLVMIVGGIGLVQAVSDPKQVTLGWLRLGGLISVALLTVVWGVAGWTSSEAGDRWMQFMLALTTLAFVVQLITVQRGRGSAQRLAAAWGYGLAALYVAMRLTATLGATGGLPFDEQAADPYSGQRVLSIAWMVLVSQGLLGGFLMTMLLGHAYLTAGGQMTQAPLRRLVVLLGALMALRVLGSGVWSLWPYLTAENFTSGRGSRVWDTVMITARWLVGLVVPALFVAMIYDCVKRRANQSATGILYVATVLVVLGEGMALALANTTGYLF